MSNFDLYLINTKAYVLGQRWAEYELQFDAFMVQFEALLPTITITTTEHKVGNFEYKQDSYELEDDEQCFRWLQKWELDYANLYLYIGTSRQ